MSWPRLRRFNHWLWDQAAANSATMAASLSLTSALTRAAEIRCRLAMIAVVMTTAITCSRTSPYSACLTALPIALDGHTPDKLGSVLGKVGAFYVGATPAPNTVIGV